MEKITSIPCGTQYKPKIENSDFVSSPELDELIRKTEDAFASVFERGNRKKALERLRDFGKKQNHHFASWRSGLLMGASLPLMIQGLVISESNAEYSTSVVVLSELLPTGWQPRTRQEIGYWGALLQLFGACYLPVFFALAFFINLATWHHGRINYVLIFELDVSLAPLGSARLGPTLISSATAGSKQARLSSIPRGADALVPS